jgi:hypothetical protein
MHYHVCILILSYVYPWWIPLGHTQLPLSHTHIPLSHTHSIPMEYHWAILKHEMIYGWSVLFCWCVGKYPHAMNHLLHMRCNLMQRNTILCNITLLHNTWSIHCRVEGILSLIPRNMAYPHIWAWWRFSGLSHIRYLPKCVNTLNLSAHDHICPYLVHFRSFQGCTLFGPCFIPPKG